MDTQQPNQPQRLHLCRSPRLTPARLAACRANARKSTGPRTARGKARSSLNALKHGRYARLLTRSLERAEANDQLNLYWNIVGRISLHFGVDWNCEQSKAECLARQVWCYGWKSWLRRQAYLRRQAVAQMRANPGSAQNSAGYKNNDRMRIRLRGNRYASALTFDFGPRRRRRLTARVIPVLGLAELEALRRLAQFLSRSGIAQSFPSLETLRFFDAWRLEVPELQNNSRDLAQV
jgi:hypothetical protein